MKRIQRNLTYANVMATVAVFLALGGGAYALTLPRNSVKSKHIKDGQVLNADLGANAVDSPKVADNALTGSDVNEATLAGVKDGCTAGLVGRYGRICAGSPGTFNDWDGALAYCTNLGLRLPSVSEAKALAANFDVFGVPANEFFWTDTAWEDNDDGATVRYRAIRVQDDGNGSLGLDEWSNQNIVVCVTEPTDAL